MTTVYAKREYKDTIFRMIFKEKEALLSLYNALNHTNHTNVEDLEINTLENAIYMNMKNEVSFVFASYLNLYEHQSTFNPNMPLRDLFYIARLYEQMVIGKNIYGTRRIVLPTPRFVVFYNGINEYPEKMVMKLSEAFEKQEEKPELELKVTVLNINDTQNRELMEQCRTLSDYMAYVNKVRTYSKCMPLAEAVEKAVEECITENILIDFFRKHRAEVIQMSIFEYDEEEHMRMEREEHEAIGRAEGEMKKLVELILRKVQKGHDIPQIAEALEETEDEIEKIYRIIMENPECSSEEILGFVLEERRIK